jgi:serine/threonine-protein kinase
MSQPSGNEIAVGTIIDNTYEVTNLLGQGGMGAVWAAQHRRLPGKRVAIKVLLGEAARDKECFARFRREAEIASRIGHPNIIEVLDFNTLASGTPYLVLEFLAGESLAARLRRGKLAPGVALPLARQIGSALHAAHRHQVVHRDLKPDNIFLCPSDSGGVLSERVKVLDFGISKIRDNSATVLTQESTLMGTPQYMSPEQASGKNKLVDQRTDIFALGCIVYEMLAGQPAFFGDSLAAVLCKVMLEAPQSLAELTPGLPANVTAAIARALEKDPAARFSDIASFIGELTGSPLQTLDSTPGGAALALAATQAGHEAFAATAASAAAPPIGALPTSPSLARGEVAKPIAEPAPRRAPPLVWAGAALLVALAAATALALIGSPHPRASQPAVTHEQPLPGAPPAAVPHEQPLPVAPPISAPKAEKTEKPATIEKANPAAATPPAAPATTPARQRALETLDPAVALELDAAERALTGGDASEAIRLARHSLLAKKSSRAFALIARAYCRAGDLGNARAALHSVRGADLARVKQDCKKSGIDLE